MSDAISRILEAAAEARAVGVRQVTDRPSQRRCAEEPSAAPIVRVQAVDVQVRASDTVEGGLHFSGFASVYNRGYEMWDIFGPYSEQVTSGAGSASLARSDLDVPLVLQHDSLRRIARTTNGSLTVDERTVDDTEGLWVDAPALDRNDADVAYIAPKLEAGLIDEMSFRFRITQGSWSADWSEYHIEGYDIHRGDVAIVGYGANPHTQGAGLRAEQVDLRSMSEAHLRQLERDVKAQLAARGHLEPKPSGMTFAELDRIDRATVVIPLG